MGTICGDLTTFDATVLVSVLERKKAELTIQARSDRETWARVALHLGIYPTHLANILSGKRQPGPKLLRLLHLRRVVTYVEDER